MKLFALMTVAASALLATSTMAGPHNPPTVTTHVATSGGGSGSIGFVGSRVGGGADISTFSGVSQSVTQGPASGSQGTVYQVVTQAGSGVSISGANVVSQIKSSGGGKIQETAVFTTDPAPHK